MNRIESCLSKASEDYGSQQRTKKGFVCCLNVVSLGLIHDDDEYYQALISSDTLLIDGVGISWLLWLRDGKWRKRTTGPDYHDQILREGSGSAFYYGSTADVVSKIKSNGAPGWNIDAKHGPLVTTVTQDEIESVVQDIQGIDADFLFLGFSAPKQEKIASHILEAVQCPVVCIGAHFEWLAGTQRRAPHFMQWMGMEWLFRITQEPARMMKRLKPSLLHMLRSSLH